MVRLRDHRRRFTLARRSFTSGSAEALPPVDSMASTLDPFEVLDVANGVLQAAVVWFDAAVLQEPPTRHSLELGATLAGTAFEIEHRYNNSFQSFMPGRLVSDGKGGYVVHDLFGRMLGPNAEVTDDVATATMPLSSLLEEWGDDEYHIAPRLERWRQHEQLAPLLAPAAVQTQWTSENVRDHPSFADFVAFMRGEEGDPSWEFDGEQEEIEAWADWLAPAAPVAPAAAPTAAAAVPPPVDILSAATAATAVANVRAAASRPDHVPPPEAAPPTATDAAVDAAAGPPEEGSFLLVDAVPVLCFMVTKTHFAVTDAKFRWVAIKHGIAAWKPCPEGQQPEVAGVIVSNNGGHIYPESFLFGKTLVGNWTLFNELRLPPADADQRMYTTSRLPKLKAGDRVDCTGKVWSGEGNRSTSGAGVTLVAIGAQQVKASGEGKRPQWRRVAVVALPDGRLTWAELMGATEGLVGLSQPSASASAEELAALTAKLPAFLATRDVSNVSSLLGRLVTADGEIHLRPRGRTPAAATTTPSAVTATAANNAIVAAGTPFSDKLDLKGVSESQIAKLSADGAGRNVQRAPPCNAGWR